MRQFSFSYRSKLLYLAFGSIIGMASLAYTKMLAEKMREKEKYEIELWSRSVALMSDHRTTLESEMTMKIIDGITDIPVVITDDFLRVIRYRNVDSTKLADPAKLRQMLEKMSSDHPPIYFPDPFGKPITVFYSNSALLQSITYFPYVQMSLIAVLISFAFITFRSTKQNEQNKVWVGMSKETAHQLGTPTSSLLGWIDYLKSQEIAPEVTEEMSRDVARLKQVADRFGKIGSSTQLIARDIYAVVSTTIDYFQTRIPRNVILKLEQPSDEVFNAMINESLFGWVIENLLKNALDALQGKGEIHLTIAMRGQWITIDVTDTGRGMLKRDFKRIFRPGVSTKTRGWGLGLSLSRRIVEEYHHGRIFVKESEVGRGTTFRVQLNRV